MQDSGNYARFGSCLGVELCKIGSCLGVELCKIHFCLGVGGGLQLCFSKHQLLWICQVLIGSLLAFNGPVLWFYSHLDLEGAA